MRLSRKRSVRNERLGRRPNVSETKNEKGNGTRSEIVIETVAETETKIMITVDIGDRMKAPDIGTLLRIPLSLCQSQNYPKRT